MDIESSSNLIQGGTNSVVFEIINSNEHLKHL
jgi:hypothetical protein